MADRPPDELLNRVTWKIPNALALIGSRAGDEWNGMTASWITQLSMEPVLIGVGIDNTAVTHRLVTAGGSFTVNLWSADDTKVFVKFSKPAAFDAEAMTLNGRTVRAGRDRRARVRRGHRLPRLRGARQPRPRHPHAVRRRGGRCRHRRRRGSGGGDERHPHEVRRRQAPLADRWTSPCRRRSPLRRGRAASPPTTSSPCAAARPAAVGARRRRQRRPSERGAAVVERLVGQPEPVYGVSTGFGALANTVIPAERSAELQTALIRSHAAGMGPEVEREVVRAMVLLRARSLAMGFSGARPVVVEAMLALLDAGVTPVVPRARLARRQRRPRPAGLGGARPARRGRGAAGRRHARRRRRPPAPPPASAPLTLRAKEGLALINGTDGMLGDARARPRRPRRAAARRPTSPARCPPRHCSAPTGPSPPTSWRCGRRSARRSARPTCAPCSPARRSSPATATATTGCRTPTRCAARRRSTAPPATPSSTPARSPTASWGRSSTTRSSCPTGGSSRAATSTARRWPPSPTSSPSSIADVGAISERRTDRLLDRTRSHGLPPFLAPTPASTPGLMIAQYTQAAMVAENRRLAVPASTDTLPTSAMQEDHVSLGWSAARKLRVAVANLGAHPRRRAGRRRRGGWRCGRRCRRRRRPARSPTPCTPRPAAPAPTSGWRPAWPPSSDSSPTARSSPRPRPPSPISADEHLRGRAHRL